jgi:hypothetical protein
MVQKPCNGYMGAGTPVRVRAAGVHGRGYAGGGGYNDFFQKKKTDRPFSNPYPFTRLYSGTGMGTGCTRRVLANLYSVPPKTSLGGQNMKTGLDALGTAENDYESVKHERWTRRLRFRRKWVRGQKTWNRILTPSVPLKTSQRQQNMKTGPDAHGTSKNLDMNII